MSPEKESENYSKKVIMESTPLVQTNLKPDRNIAIDLFSPIVSNPVENSSKSSENLFKVNGEMSYGIDDISTWLGGKFNIT